MTKSVAILGGGISGMSAAFHLLKHSLKIGVPAPKIKIFESQNRFGGWMKSIRYGEGREDFFDLGPRTIRTATAAGCNVIEMVSDIGLESQLRAVTSKSQNFKKRFIAYDGGLVQLPSGPAEIWWGTKPLHAFFRYLLAEIQVKKFDMNRHDDLSVDQFFRTRFGRDIADYVINPMCTGITGGDSSSLSMKCVFPDILKGEQQYGSVVMWMLRNKSNRFAGFEDNALVMKSKKEKWSVISFEGGIGTFSDRLAEYLEGCEVELSPGTSIEKLRIETDTCYVNDQQFDHVFSSLPSHALSPLLKDHENTKKLAIALRWIPFVDMAVVSFRFPNSVQLPEELNGFGFLVPSKENAKILGVIYDSSIFDDNSSSKFTVMLGGSRFREHFGSPDTVKNEHLVKVSQEALSKYLKIDASNPIETMVSIHRQCIPQYNFGHLGKIEKIDNFAKGLPLSLIGSSYRGFSVPDCILNAKLEANKYVESLN